MVDPSQIYIYAQKHPMVFSAPGHEKNRTKIPGQQNYNEFFYEGKKIKNSLIYLTYIHARDYMAKYEI